MESLKLKNQIIRRRRKQDEKYFKLSSHSNAKWLTWKTSSSLRAEKKKTDKQAQENEIKTL